MLYSTKLENTSNTASKLAVFMYKTLQFLIIWASISVLSISYADTSDNSTNKLSKMSCKELLEKLVETSSYGTTFLNKKNNMGFYFERSNSQQIGLTFVNNAASPKEIIYANSEIDLANNTLKLIDSEVPTFIEINKKYIPYIASKCTSDKNEYRRGKSPDPKYDGIFIERHERWDHPVLAVFEKYGFLLNKVSYSQDGKFPTFYVTLKYSLHIPFDSKDFNKVYFEIIKANSSFPYALVEQDKNIYIHVGWSDKAKKLLKIKINKADQAHVTQNDEVSKDKVIIDKIYLTNNVMPIIQTDPMTQNEVDKVLIGDTITDKFTNKDSIIYFMANISVLRPSKKYYNVIVDCINSKGEIVYKGAVKRSLSGYSYQLDNDLVKGYNQTLGLNPKLGAMIKDQRIPLVDGQDYYIKLIVENKLVSITKFNYEVVSD